MSDETNDDLLGGIAIESTKDLEVPPLLIDQVIGQEHASEIIKKAAQQRRHVMLIGTPGTGKSMLAQAMAELLPKEELKDVLIYHNHEDANNPKIREVRAGKGMQIINAHKIEAQRKAQLKNTILLIVGFAILLYAASLGGMALLWGILAVLLIMVIGRQFVQGDKAIIPKLIVNNANKDTAPFVDATGAHSGALLGDVRHDPFQSGGLETPSHDRVEAGDIHKAHKGVLFIDEINILRPESQQSLLTALQEKEYAITGQSERSSGALVKTYPVPCNFIMIAAGNLDAMEGMHPALRSRIKGYGYEIYMRDSMDDTPENRRKIVRFVAQEVEKDGKIPHFDKSAVQEILREARRRSGRKGHLTLKLRDLGGLVRVSGDVAHAAGAQEVTASHVLTAKQMSRSVEQQLADQYLEQRMDYRMYHKKGAEIGRVNGLAIMGGDSGIVLPIMAEVTPALSKNEGKLIATGMLKDIAKEAVQNVSALIKKVTGRDTANMDIHVQFIGTYEGVEGDSASISIATAVISAFEGIPIDQSIAMTGSLSVRGDVLPVGGVTYKIEAAAQAGIKTVIIPKANEDDVLIEDKYRDMITIVPVSKITEVLELSLVGKEKDGLLETIKRFSKKVSIPIPDINLPGPSYGAGASR
jgi:Lon-like ATP-dependent protease